MAEAVQGASIAHLMAPSWAAQFRRLAVLVVAVVLALTIVAIEAPAAAASPAPDRGTQAARVLRYARSHIGARFRMGAEGMRYFDCSGLVYRVYKEAGLLHKIGGARLGARSYMRWFQRRGLVSRRNPRSGDLIIWGKNGKVHHIGIYMYDNRAISALINPWGVMTHRVNGLPLNVMAFLHVRITR